MVGYLNTQTGTPSLEVLSKVWDQFSPLLPTVPTASSHPLSHSWLGPHWPFSLVLALTQPPPSWEEQASPSHSPMTMNPSHQNTYPGHQQDLVAKTTSMGSLKREMERHKLGPGRSPNSGWQEPKLRSAHQSSKGGASSLPNCKLGQRDSCQAIWSQRCVCVCAHVCMCPRPCGWQGVCGVVTSPS